MRPERYAHCVQMPAATAIAVACGPSVSRPTKPTAYPRVIVALPLDNRRSSLKRDVATASATNPARDVRSTRSVWGAKRTSRSAPATITPFV